MKLAVCIINLQIIDARMTKLHQAVSIVWLNVPALCTQRGHGCGNDICDAPTIKAKANGLNISSG
jgi:hypothetical protein